MYHTKGYKPNYFITTGHVCFNEHDFTKLEDWLMDIETAADLTSESQAKLAKAKSRGLTHTLVTEAITSNTSWEGIKDLLCLKLAMQISLPIPFVSWISNSRKRNPLQHTSTGSKQRQRDVTSQMMLPLLGFSSRD